MTQVKICGISTVEDGDVAVTEGADFLGFVFYPRSHRYIAPDKAASIIRQLRMRHTRSWQAVGVVVNEPAESMNQIASLCELDLVQVCGEEDREYCEQIDRPVIKALRIEDGARLTEADVNPARYGAVRVLLDTHRPGMYGGTGEVSDWQALAPIMSGAILAGGLQPHNVAQAVESCRPWGVDVSSGVERDKRKDQQLIREFLRAVRALDGVRA